MNLKNELKKTIVLAAVFFVFFPCIIHAEDADQEKKNRIEAVFSYEYLNPNETYGEWKGLSLAFYRTPSSDLTYFIQGGTFWRKEGNGFTGTVGAYKDWLERLYTYSAVSAGTNSEYLPKFRIDHDFNFKLGPEKNIVWIAGISYLQYFGDHRDLILSTGVALYYPEDWVWEYRIFRNDSSPGNVISYSHLISAGYGREKWQWTYLDVSFGNQAYNATNLESPEKVDQNALRVGLRNKTWIGKDYGVMGDVSFFKLQDGYKKYGFSLGVFKEF
ncbi:MAG: YaiO family outer membrane beta-barrel protein [Nitrospiraceae bacterium]|nr:YaiO family outer membrane beta-barrel protein [Nitrospiraceae bacterium]